MKYTYLNSNRIYTEEPPKALQFLYSTTFGRFILKVITAKIVSKFIGFILNLRISTLAIKKYIKNNSIDMNKFETKKYKSFNDFFTRNVKSIEKTNNQDDFISTADSKISYYKISRDLIVNIKNSKYTIGKLLENDELAKEYEDGICLIYRLSPCDYHRYIYADDGIIKLSYKIGGKLHTVNPIVYDKYSVFTENSREVTALETKNFGKMIQIEVGALCVGKIVNTNKNSYKRYEEKGHFEFGGSTIIQLIKKDTIQINQEIIENTKRQIETKVEVGQIIGTKIN